MPDEFAEVVAAVREQVVPGPAERDHLQSVADDLIARTGEALAARDVEGDVLLVGSTARGTWLAGDRDIDVFVRFPPDLPREDLEAHGLAIGRAVLPDGREEYAEHPYIKGEFEGFDVDLVPCFGVESASDIQSAVDRTPFHTEYLEARLTDELADDVRVAKQFLTAIGAYGSDLRTEGFSGYLVELLVLEHGGFRGLVEAAADWSPPVRFDPADHGRATFDDPLVVVDPTDPGRNVAAALSRTNLARFQHYARELLAAPREALFVHTEPDPLTPEAVEAHVADRGTVPVAVCFETPDLVDDQLYPQLRRSLSGIVGELDRRGFAPLRSATWAADRAVVFVECGVGERPAVERHEGPPLAARRHAEGFYEKYAESDAYGPFVDGERYVVEREREFRTPGSFLESEAIFDVALGADVADALADSYEVLVGDAVASLAASFGVELARYFDPRP